MTISERPLVKWCTGFVFSDVMWQGPLEEWAWKTGRQLILNFPYLFLIGGYEF